MTRAVRGLAGRHTRVRLRLAVNPRTLLSRRAPIYLVSLSQVLAFLQLDMLVLVDLDSRSYIPFLPWVIFISIFIRIRLAREPFVLPPALLVLASLLPPRPFLDLGSPALVPLGKELHFLREDALRDLEVLAPAPCRLTLDHDARGEVRHLRGGVGLVDLLAARAGTLDERVLQLGVGKPGSWGQLLRLFTRCGRRREEGHPCRMRE